MVMRKRMNVMLRAVLAGGLIAAAAACSGSRAIQKSEAAPPAAVAAAEASAQPALIAVRAESVPSPRLVLRTNGNPAYTSYSPQPDVFVVDLPRTAKANGLEIPSDLPAAIASVSVDQAIELGQPLTRVTLRFTQAASATAGTDGDSVVISLPGAVGASEVAESAPAPEPVAVAAEPVTVSQVISEDLPVTAPTAVTEPTGPAASILTGVDSRGTGADLQLTLQTDGVTEYSAFRLTNPLRLVVDLKGVKNRVTNKAIELGDPVVRKVRVSQFKSSPDVARVVLDLDEIVEHHVTKTEKGLVISFGDAPVATATAEVRTPATAAVSDPQPKQAVVRTASVPVVPADVPAIAPVAYERHVVNSPAPEPAPQTTTSPVTTSVRTSTPEPTDNVFAEQGTTAGTSPLSGGATAPGRTLTAGQQVFTGEPIDLRLKEADIKDVLRTFAQLTGLNIAIDPNVGGSVTVEFDDVPWDQALDIILKQNGLTYVLDGNVMRVGTIDRLAAEQAQIRQLQEDEQLNVPLQTVIKHLSYAKADAVTTLLKKMASKRGQIEYDQRTNQIIITEIPSFLSTMLNLIETIDIPTPQVMIEARVVETTKQFARQLGINWGFRGVMDPALGTGTGLVFPNTVNAVGGPFNFGAGNPVLSLTLGNVLGTFDLDVTLTAAESEGLVRVVSAPKVMTQDNQAAEIQSGTQIPIQTRINNTTTVTYVDATLRLSVTPQITTADTVIMEITVQKTEPGTVAPGATNASLITRRATTKLMVRDGGTAVIGGIYQSSETRGQSRLPFVSDIPVVGNLFKNRDFRTNHDELLIFITPRIMRNA
jgi:type IV pilus assembly protein PilQ